MLNKNVILNYSTLNSQHVPIECSTSSPIYVQTVHPTDDIVINIQLPYDLNTSIEPKLWDGNFHPISLHSSIEHLVLDSKNIKNSLNSMAKYCSNYYHSGQWEY